MISWANGRELLNFKYLSWNLWIETIGLLGIWVCSILKSSTFCSVILGSRNPLSELVFTTMLKVVLELLSGLQNKAKIIPRISATHSTKAPLSIETYVCWILSFCRLLVDTHCHRCITPWVPLKPWKESFHFWQFLMLIMFYQLLIFYNIFYRPMNITPLYCRLWIPNLMKCTRRFTSIHLHLPVW